MRVKWTSWSGTGQKGALGSIIVIISELWLDLCVVSPWLETKFLLKKKLSRHKISCQNIWVVLHGANYCPFLYTNNTSVILPLKYRGEYRVIYIFICIRKPVLEFLTGCCYYLKVIPWFVLGLCWYCYLFVIPYHCFNPRLHYGLISIYKLIVPLLFTEVLLLPTFHFICFNFRIKYTSVKNLHLHCC